MKPLVTDEIQAVLAGILFVLYLMRS